VVWGPVPTRCRHRGGAMPRQQGSSIGEVKVLDLLFVTYRRYLEYSLLVNYLKVKS
jgi:hypothetical protein